jgi:hypothetical protein
MMTTTCSLLTCSAVVAALAGVPAEARADSEVCYTAAPLALGARYRAGNGITAPGHALKFLAFQPPSGAGAPASGHATVAYRAVNGDSTKGLDLRGITLRHDGDPAQTAITVRYADFGGGVNLRVNGAAVVAGRFGTLAGTQLGGAAIAVDEGAPQPARVGRLRLTGPLASVAIGGASLLVIEVCGTTPGA